jgi:S-adenosylmethionine decarboxylase
LKHTLADIRCSSPVTDERQLYNALLQAANDSGATVLQPAQWNFHPQGFSAVVLLANAHVAIHTFPQNFLIKADCFSYDGKMNPEHLLRNFARLVDGELKNTRTIDRSDGTEEMV